MKKTSTLFLKLIVLLIALVTLAGLIRFPQLEGRATNLDLLGIYSDPLILYMYLASTPFFIGLFQAFKLLNFIEANRAFSQVAVNTLRNMKWAAMSLIGAIAGALVYIRFFANGEDSAGPIMLGICLSIAFGVLATAAGLFQKLFQNAVDMKSENDLTV